MFNRNDLSYKYQRIEESCIPHHGFYPGGGEESRGGEGGQRDEGAELKQSPNFQTL